MTYTLSRSARTYRVGFRLILTAMAMMMAGASAPSPFYPILQGEFGFSAMMMTGIFAIYAVALLCTLLITGSLSDHLGRRPVLSGGFALLALSLLLFWHAGGVGTLLVARVLQGIASGLLLSAISATVVDLEPRERPGSAAVWNSVLPLGGLAIGALASGLILDFGGAPEGEVFGGLVLIYLCFALLVWMLPETAPRHEGLLQALRPRIGLPRGARAAFWQSAPAVFAGWATGGLYLSLGPLIVAHVFGVTDYFLQSLVVALLAGSGSAACFVARKHSARRTTLFGTSALAIGTLLTIVGVQMQSLPPYLVAVVLAGTGFGTCFYGVMRTVIPMAAPDERAELFATLFTLSYLAFGVPVVIAGLALPYLGLSLTVSLFGGVIVVFAGFAGLWRAFGSRD